jgi:hypothetical protein
MSISNGLRVIAALKEHGCVWTRREYLSNSDFDIIKNYFIAQTNLQAQHIENSFNSMSGFSFTFIRFGSNAEYRDPIGGTRFAATYDGIHKLDLSAPVKQPLILSRR